MFDTYRPETHIKHPENIIEKKAPTDESIKILREMEQHALEHAENSIREKIFVKTNLVDFTLVFRHKSLDVLQQPLLYMKMKINDKILEETFYIKKHMTQNEMLDDCVKFIKEWLVEKILEDPIRECCYPFVHSLPLDYKRIGEFDE